MSKPRLSPRQILNMNFGFLGIQFGWGLQLANMSAIYERLGTETDKIPILWLAAPLTGLIVQPIIGAASDRTWTRLGRRRPYFLVGAVLASAALFMMPSVTSIWMAVTLLWLLDASINVSMEPFRAFVGDKLPGEQRTTGFAVQSLLIGIGATLANALPYTLRWLGVTGATASGIPLTVKYAFRLGAAAFLLAVLWTVFTTSESPPAPADPSRAPVQHRPWHAEILDAIREMPTTMRQLAAVQLFTWLGLFCMWLYFGVATARHVFGATDAHSDLYNRGVEWGGVCFAAYAAVNAVVALVLQRVAAATSRKAVHAVALACGGLGLLAVYVIHSPYFLLLTMVGVGVAWASILAMPYAMLVTALPPERMGVYMGVFNFFIVLPEIAAALLLQPLVKHAFGNNPVYVVMFGGASMLVAAVLVLRVNEGAAALRPASAAGGARAALANDVGSH
jgi:maltose/moltooligosaccharide transporter